MHFRKRQIQAYLDIDNFKAYNDVYGFENGDRVLKLLSSVIVKNMNRDEFIGHVGGYDFVIIVNDHVETDYFRKIVTEFEAEVLKLCNRDDVERGYIMAANRQNIKVSFLCFRLIVVADESVSCIGMDEIDQPGDRVRIHIVDAQNLVRFGRAFPGPCLQIDDEAPDPCDLLRFPQQVLAFFQGFSACLRSLISFRRS